MNLVKIARIHPVPFIPRNWINHAKRAIRRAVADHPRLTRGGYDQESRNPFDERAVATAIAYIICGPVKRVKAPTAGSYYLKHRAEAWGSAIGFDPYVANGDMIVAALYCNLRLSKPDGPNCAISLSPMEGARFTFRVERPEDFHRRLDSEDEPMF